MAKRDFVLQKVLCDGSMNQANAKPDELLHQALALHQKGSLNEARLLYERILSEHPRHSDALHLLGVTHIQHRNYTQALPLIERAIEVNPTLVAAHFNRALALKALNQLQAAQAGVSATLALEPEHPPALHQQGLVLQTLGRTQEALQCFEQLVAITPGDATALTNKGVLLFELGRWSQAEAAFRQALLVQVDNAQAHFNLGTALQEQGRLEEALTCYDDAIKLQPDLAQAHANRGNVLKDLKRYDAAVASLSTAIALVPEDALAYSNRGNVFKAMLKLAHAVQDYDAALRLQADLADAHLNKSLALLLDGRFELGWPAYEWRWQTKASKSLQRNYAQAPWRGESDIRGKTILLYTEQGLGDTLQFCRYAQVLAERGARVILEVPASLRTVLQGLAGVDQWVIKGESLPPFDVHCPLLSLPFALQTRMATIPAPQAYLRASPEKMQAWSDLLGPRRRPRVGLVWSGSTTHTNDRNRSMPLTTLLSHLPPGIDYISLQKDLRAADRDVLDATPWLRHFGQALQDFSDTAALCALMDVVISVDTSVAHLSGALGQPTWVLLPFSPDWRWLLQRDDSPWYPSMRLYRQGDDLSWSPVLQSVANHLSQL